MSEQIQITDGTAAERDNLTQLKKADLIETFVEDGYNLHSVHRKG